MEMREIAQVTWVGPLVMGLDEVVSVPSDVPCVYLLHVFSPLLASFPVVYAGQTSDLRRRLEEHMSPASANPVVAAIRRKRSAYFSATVVVHPGLRTRIEAGLIALLRPVGNVQRPEAIPLLVNLPPLHLFTKE